MPSTTRAPTHSPDGTIAVGTALSTSRPRDLAASLVSGGNRTTTRHGITLARYLRTEWLPSRTPLLAPTTIFRYETMTEHYVLPALGRVPIRALTVTQLKHLYADLLAHGRRDGRLLTPKTVLNVHQISSGRAQRCRTTRPRRAQRRHRRRPALLGRRPRTALLERV